MKKRSKLLFLCGTFVLVGFLVIPGSASKRSNTVQDIKHVDFSMKPQDSQLKTGKIQVDLDFGKSPLYFITNKGQVNKQAKFYAKTSRYTLWLTKDGLVFDSVKKVEDGIKEEAAHFGQSMNTLDKAPNKNAPDSPHFHRDVSRLIFLNANKHVEIVPVKETELRVNYFKGNDSSKWHSDVPTSQAILYKNIYRNIDLKVYGIEKQIEYDWIVKPGGDPGEIRLQYQNVKRTRLDDDNNLLIETQFGELIHKKPVSYQKQNAQAPGTRADIHTCPGERTDIDVTFKKIDEHIYGFTVGDYNSNKELIIDPVVLAYSTYLGGQNADEAKDIVLDSSGYLYVVGCTYSWDFPVLNQYQSDQAKYDAFVSKIDTSGSGGSSLLYSTYLGGEEDDYGMGIALDSNGIVYLIGYTRSFNFPLLNPYMTKPPYTLENNRDVFVTKLDITQSGAGALLYSTYMGGGNNDYGWKIVADDTGKVIISGMTESDNFPILNYFQTRQYMRDGFVAKLDTTQSGGDCLLYSTYLGGTGTEYLNAMAVDSSGYTYVVGYTESVNFPVRNQYQEFQSPGDGFLTKFDLTQSGDDSLLYSTYLGGSGNDSCATMAVDSNGIATIGGSTYSTNFPLLNSYQTYNANGDGFIMQVDTLVSGSACLLYSTYLGGSSSEGIYGVTLDSSGYIHAAGITNSTDFPTLYPYQTDQPLGDLMILKLDPAQPGTASLLYSTYLGGDGVEYLRAIILDSSEDIYIAGYTESTDFPTLNQYQNYNTDGDAFITRLYFQTLPTVITDDVSSISFTSASCGGDVTSDGKAAVTARGVCWSTSENPTIADSHTTDGSGTGSFTSSLTNLIPNTVYYVRAYATNCVDTAYGNEVSFETLEPTITVTSPNGGESWVVGTVHNITWTSDGVEGNINIEYSANNGESWTEIISSTENDGTHPWTVPDAVSDQCLIRVSVTDSSPDDTSDALFTILPPSISVTSPNGGESWETGSSQNITWTCIGTVGNIKIEYSTDNGSNWTEIITSTANDGTHPWTVPDTASNQCLIRVSESDGSPTDTSDAVFTIFAPSITVTSPNGGENWHIGSAYDITWTCQGTVGNVRIEYSLDGGNSWDIIVESTENDGSYNWNVPAKPSTNCLVRVSETDEDGGPSDTSDAVFSIVSTVTGTITLRSPNGSETWLVGSTQEIIWNSTGDINYVNIRYSKDNGTTWKTIAQNLANNHSYNWVIPEAVSDQCLVRIAANDSDIDPKPADVSDAVFSIVLPPTPTIKVNSPNGGEQLVKGSWFTITWDAANTREDVRLEYSIDGGQNWREITIASGNIGKYEWVVPDAPSDNCLVRISETDGQPSDVSDAVFSIVAPLPGDITVTSPNGGETLTAGSSQDVTWTGSGEINNVTIEYSGDNGTTWKTIVQTTPNNGNFNWTVPNIASDQCLVRITSNDGVSDPLPSDISDAVFSIVPPATPSITVITPNGGEQLLVNSTTNITWQAIESREDVKIEYSVNGGQDWTVIIDATANNGDYKWIVPDTPSEACLVRISETAGQPLDISDAVFSIVEPLPGEITVTTPNGGERWTVGSLQEITWTVSGGINNVTIEYSIDFGTTWQVIIQTTANDGSYDWTIPETVSDECLVRVSSNDGDPDPVPADISDNVFSIIPDLQGELKVTSPNGGESWEVGTTHPITWTGTGTINNVMIEYSYDSGNTWNTVVSSISNSGAYNWQVPDTVSSECLVRVSGNEGESESMPMDVSDSEFSIVLPLSPTIRVITPNGGEELVIGSIYEITWFSNNSREPIRIEYSVNGGQSWTEIIASTENDGDYDWTVPDEPSRTCLVRISETNGQPVDISDAVFSIVAPGSGDLTVLTPNGGESLDVGPEYNITWTGSGFNNVIIEYSVNNGETWLYIDKVPTDNGSYAWTVPGPPSEDCLVRITGADSDENPSDVSDGVFTILDPSLASIEVLNPNGGENLGVGEEFYITWASTGLNNVLIEYSTNNGEQWTTIATVPAAGGRFTWTVPDTPSETCLIRITGDDSPGDPSDVSDGLFSIMSD